MFPFFFGKSKHKIFWESVYIAFDGLIHGACLNTIYSREVVVKHHLLATDIIYCIFYYFWL